MGLYHGAEDVKPAGLTGYIIREVVDATLDLTKGEEKIDTERKRVLRVFLRRFGHCLRLVPAPPASRHG